MLGVIGGTGLYNLPELEGVWETSLDTPWGAPSSSVVTRPAGMSDSTFVTKSVGTEPKTLDKVAIASGMLFGGGGI